MCFDRLLPLYFSVFIYLSNTVWVLMIHVLCVEIVLFGDLCDLLITTNRCVLLQYSYFLFLLNTCVIPQHHCYNFDFSPLFFV